MSDLGPFALAARQIEIDRDATAWMPPLGAHKKDRLAASPHAFLRGSATLFYEILGARPDLAAGPAGDGFIVGDMHLENVGAYRNDEADVVFGLNDFDDAGIGPLHLDVLRLSVSVLLAGRGFRATGTESLSLVSRLTRAYLDARAGGAAPDTPGEVSALVVKVRARSKKELLDKRAPMNAAGKRHFERGDRYLDVPAEWLPRLPALLARYLGALGDRAPARSATWKIEDHALRIAGNGSLGALRIALLVRDNDGEERLVELKEARPASCAALCPRTPDGVTHPAERVVRAARALVASPPRHLAAVELDGRSFVGRRLFPQEDKLALDAKHTREELADLARYIGHLLGAAHARGLASLNAPRAAAWSARETDDVIDHAVELAGMIEGVYLAWSRRSG